MQVWTYTLASVALVSVASLAGVFTLSLKKDLLRRILLFLVSFAVGGLFGDAFIHLLPESFRIFGLGPMTPLCVIGGILVFFVLEKFIRWRHCHDDTCECHGHTKPVVAMNLVSDAVHNLIDGMLIAASYFVSIPLGLATTLAVVLHEIPQEIGDFAVLIHGGLSTKKALLFNFLSALTSVLGAALTLMIGPHIHDFAQILLPITAGGFIYIAGSDLIPELHHEVRARISFWQLICILLGIGVMAALLFVEA